MQEIMQRSASESADFHRTIPVRVYSEDGVQFPRITRARNMLEECLAGCSDKSIVEIGCGTADISGPYAERYSTIGYDVAPLAIERGRNLYPQMEFYCVDIATVRPAHGGVLVLCEFLEHIKDPQQLCRDWMPGFEYSVISHPLEGDITPGVNLSGGEHQWSFNKADFENWFVLGGHELQSHCVFAMGGYNIIIGWGKRK